MGVLVRRVFEALVKGSPWGSIVLSLVSQCSYACCSCVNKNVSEGKFQTGFWAIFYFY